MQSALAQQQLSQAQPQQLPLLQQQQGLPEIENILQQQSVGLDVKLVNGNGLPDAAGPPVMLVCVYWFCWVYVPRVLRLTFFAEFVLYTGVGCSRPALSERVGHILNMLNI